MTWSHAWNGFKCGGGSLPLRSYFPHVETCRIASPHEENTLLPPRSPLSFRHPRRFV
jgi:hypothetical protein